MKPNKIYDEMTREKVQKLQEQVNFYTKELYHYNLGLQNRDNLFPDQAKALKKLTDKLGPLIQEMIELKSTL